MSTVAFATLLAALASCRSRPAATIQAAGPPALPHAVTVEVLNASQVAGAGRTATLLLRHAGLDVVYFGNADSVLAGLARIRVLVRRGDTTGAGRVVEALGQAEIVQAPDSSRLVDLTVLLGRGFSPESGGRL